MKLVSIEVEEIAAEPGEPGEMTASSAYPAGSGVNVVLQATIGTSSQKLVFSLLSPPYASIKEHEWGGFTFTVTHASDSKAHLKIALLKT